MMRKLLPFLLAALLIVTGCSTRELPALSDAPGGDAGSDPALPVPDGTGEQAADIKQSAPPDLSTFTTVGYDYEPGDFSHRFELSGALQSEFEALLQADAWEIVVTLPEYGLTTLLTAVNADGDRMSIGPWDDRHSYVAISGGTDSAGSALYRAPLDVSEDARAFRKKLDAHDPTRGGWTEFSVGAVTFSLALPEGWTAKGNEVFADDRAVFAILPCVANGDGKAFEAVDARHQGVAEATEITLHGYRGKYYHLQTEVTKGGMTGFENELLYYLDIGGQLLCFSFSPARGIGIGTQREEFEAVLEGIQVAWGNN